MVHGELLLRLLREIAWLICLSLASPLYIAHASADELVHFQSAPVRSTPFQQRIAKQSGEAPKDIPGASLQGYLTRPQGEGPFPAVILLHGCAGVLKNDKETWPERLSSWGYAVLVVDSFTTRGIHDTCHSLLADRVYDAYGALDFLSKSGFVDPKRIAVMGFSAGGIATLEAAQLGGVEQLMERKFKAAIAYYPNCSVANGDMAVPTLILVGELDDWSTVKKCQEMMTQRDGKGSPVQLKVYKGARHAFDAPEFKTGIEAYGHRVEYNAVAANQSIGDVHALLQQVFGG